MNFNIHISQGSLLTYINFSLGYKTLVTSMWFANFPPVIWIMILLQLDAFMRYWYVCFSKLERRHWQPYKPRRECMKVSVVDKEKIGFYSNPMHNSIIIKVSIHHKIAACWATSYSVEATPNGVVTIDSIWCQRFYHVLFTIFDNIRVQNSKIKVIIPW